MANFQAKHRTQQALVINKEITLRKLTGSVSWSLLNHALARGSLMLSALILSRSFSFSEFAAYSYFQLTVSMIAAYSAMGLGITASKYFAEFETKVETHNLGLLWGLSIVFSLAFSGAIFFTPTSWIGADLPIPKWLYSLGILTLALNVIPSGAILGLERYKEAALVGAISGGIMIFGSLAVASQGRSAPAIEILIVSAFIQAAGQTLVVVRIVSWKTLLRSSTFTAINVREIARTAGPMLLVTLLAASGTWILGRIILNRPDGDRLFSVYAIGLQWFSFSLLVPGILSKVLLPRFVKENQQSKRDGNLAQRLTRLGTFSAGIISLGALIIGFFFDSTIAELYGKKHELPPHFVTPYLAAAVVVSPINVIGSRFIADGCQREWLALTAMWFMILLICAHSLISLDSALGPTTLGISYGVFAVVALGTAHQKKMI